MQYTLIPLSDIDAGQLEQWQQLADVALEPNPFYEPSYLMPFARSLGDDFHEVALAVVSDTHSWLAVMPVCRVGRWHRIPLPSLSEWRGRGLLQALIGTPLISSARVEDAVAALLGGVVRSPGSFFTGLECLVEDGPVFEAILSGIADAGLRSLRFDRSDRAFLTRRAECDYLEQALAAKHRNHVRRQWRQLCEHLGEEPQLVDRSADPAAVAELIELEGRSHLAERGTVLQADPAQALFFTEMCAGFAARGRLQLLALEAGGRALAIKCNLFADPGIFYLKVAYDERYAKFSPGVQLEVRMFTAFHERPQASWVDSCASSNNDTCNRLLRGRRSLVSLTVINPTLRALAAAPVILGARHLRDRRNRAAA